MDDIRVGSVIRAVRIRRGLRQSDVAQAAGVSDTVVSSIECGQLEEVSLGSLRRVCQATGVSLPFAPRWRGAEMTKLLDERHAVIVGVVVRQLSKLGWEVIPEHTFAVYGERGSIDVFAWLPARRALLIVEAKSSLSDLQDTLASMNRKRRLAVRLARELGWQPLVIAVVLVLPGESQARNAIAANKSLFDVAYPADTLAVRRWIRRPAGDLRGIWFVKLSNSAVGGAKKRVGNLKRVHAQRNAAVKSVASVTKTPNGGLRAD